MKEDQTPGNRLLRGTLASAIALAPAVAANAQQAGASANINATMEVSVPPCQVTGSTIDLGTYIVDQTAADVAARNGGINISGEFESSVGNNPRPQPGVIGTIRCPVAVNWDVSVVGQSTAAGNIGYIDLVNAANPSSSPLVLVPYGTITIAPGTPNQVPGTYSFPINQGAGGITLSGVGTGNDQPLRGGYVVFQDGTTNPALVEGAYTNSATILNVNFTPQVDFFGGSG